jgi:hypothetical protein
MMNFFASERKVESASTSESLSSSEPLVHEDDDEEPLSSVNTPIPLLETLSVLEELDIEEEEDCV